MSTKVYGCSDDLIEFDGDVRGEVGFYSGDDDKPCLLIFDDGTMLTVKYGKQTNGGIWSVELAERGSLFDRIEICTDDEADPYSDVAHFRDGLKRAWAAKDWEPVR